MQDNTKYSLPCTHLIVWLRVAQFLPPHVFVDLPNHRIRRHAWAPDPAHITDATKVIRVPI